MARFGTPIFLTLLLLMGCSLSRSPPDLARQAADLPELPSGPSLDVLAFGDWGTGGPGQRTMAKVMEETHRPHPPALVLLLGDNFYPFGVKSTEDPLWDRVFENVYSGPFWDSLTFLPALGNHDWFGNRLAEVQYSQVDPRWQMEGFHYETRAAMPGGGTVLVLVLDTTPLQGERDSSLQQMAWMDSVLGGSRDRWVIAAGHHPLATEGFHVADEYFRQRVIPVLARRSPLYVSGHNHSQEILPASPDLLQAVCGGGAGRDNEYGVGRTDQTLAAFTDGGWCYLRFFPDVMAIELYDVRGDLRFRHLIPWPGY